MSSNLHKIKYYQEYTRSYDVRYIAEISHTGLNEFRVLRDKEKSILEHKVSSQLSKWDEKWSKIQSISDSKRFKENNTQLAEEQTFEAQKAIKEIENILTHTLSIDDTIDWESLKDQKRYSIKNPYLEVERKMASIKEPARPALKTHIKEPQKNDAIFVPKLTLLDNIFPSLKKKKVAKANQTFATFHKEWLNQGFAIDQYNKNLDVQFENAIEEVSRQRKQIDQGLKEQEKLWLKDKLAYEQNQSEYNAKIDDLKRKYFEKDSYAVVEYCTMVLNNSEYPDSFPKDFDIDFNAETGVLVLDYVLPSIEDFPKITEVKYIHSKKELKEYYISESQLTKMFDTAMYNITLRSIHELFEADKTNALACVTFNGWINYINKANGKKESNCIVSIQINKKDFSEIDLAHIDPKICFKNFKGVGSSKLYGITPIQPIIQINKNDKRFVNSYEVANQLEEGSNLAIMPWEDFEHLIREIFEKEFSYNGGEVKVTQASRDGGVDAIAFDPDPIRGGKIIIQAKRYTNTVGVSAVRDLYGTVHNEGATKGILVTTSDYGPDAYEFAKSKPLTLMNGANLLYLLERHGYKARINIKEAKGIA